MYLGDFAFGTTVRRSFVTVNATAGAPSAFTDGAIIVYRNGSTAGDTTGVSLTSTFAGLVGNNHVSFSMSTTGFYSSAGEFVAVVSSGTVASQSVAGYVIAHWSLGRKAPVTVSTAVIATISSAVAISTASLISTAQTIASVGTVSSTIDVNVALWRGVAPSTLGTNNHLRVSTTQGLGGAGSSLVNVVEWAGSTVGAAPYGSSLVTAANYSSAVNVAEWRGTAPSTLGTNAHVRISSTSAILRATTVGSAGSVTGSVGSVASTVAADVRLWLGTAPSTLGTNNNLVVSTTQALGAAGSTNVNVVEWNGVQPSTLGTNANLVVSTTQALGAAGSTNVNVVEWAGSTAGPAPYGSSNVSLTEWRGVTPSTLGTNANLVVSTTQGLGGAGATNVNVVEWAGSTAGPAPYGSSLVTAANYSSAVNVAEWRGVAPSTLGTNGHLRVSTTQGLGGAGATNVNVVEWQGAAPSTLGTNAHVRVSSTSAILSVTAAGTVNSVASTVDANVRLWLGTAPSTLGTNSYLRVSTTQGLGGGSSNVNVAEWRGTAPSTLGPNGNVQVSSDAAIASVGTVTGLVSTDVQAAVQAALVDNNLDHLLAGAGSSLDVADGSLLAQIVSGASTPTWASFNSTTDSLQAIRDNQSTLARVVEWDGSTVGAPPYGSSLVTAANYSSNVNVAEWRGVAPSTLGTNNHVRISSTSAILSATTVGVAGSVTTKTGYALASSGLSSVSSTGRINFALAATGLDAITLPEPSGVPSTLPTLPAGVGLGFHALRNRIDVSATEKVFYNDASAAIWRKAVSQDSTSSTGVYTEGQASS